MKLWPFSKKSDMDGILDRTMDLPPGVVLAAPDEPASSAPLSIHAPSPVVEGPLTDPAVSSVTEQAAQSQSAIDDLVLDDLVLKDPFVPSQSPMATLPAELPDALFSDSAAALWAPSAPEAEPLAPMSTESSNLMPDLEPLESLASLASEPSPLAPDNLAPQEPLMGTLWSPSVEPTVPSLPSISVATEPAVPPVAVTPIETAPVESALVEPFPADLFNNADLLAPPPLALESASDSFVLPEPSSPEVLSQSLTDSLEDQFHNLEPFNNGVLPAEANFDPDPLPLVEQVASLETPESALIVGDVAPFLPPESEQEESFESVSLGESLEEHQTASEILAGLMADSAKTSQPDGFEEVSLEPLHSEDGFSDGFEADLTAGFSSENDSFFADVPLDAMDGFAQPDEESQTGLFTLEENSQADALDDLFQSSNAAFASPETSSDWSSEFEQPEMLVSEAPESFQPASVAEECLGADSEAEDVVYALDDVNERDEPGEIFAFDEQDGLVVGSDLESYDWGHYDDPDSPIEAFDLGNGEEPEPVLSLDMETGSPSQEMDSSFAWTQSDDELARPQVAANIEELFDEPADLPDAAVAQSNSFVHDEPSALVEASWAPAPLEPPKSMPVQPSVQSVSPIQESPFKASSSTNRIYSDSLADALESFEQEVLLRDTRFLKQSINNLVDRYFAQNKPENEW